MENGTGWGNMVAAIAIVLFLLLVLAVFIRTMMLFGALTLMPLSRMWQRLKQLGRRER
jgi:hypothetical protein